MSAFLIVRAVVPEASIEAFDHWYETEHLPDAKKAFDAVSARRGWSDVTPGLHVAIYEFRDLEHARNVSGGQKIGELIAEFDRVWKGAVTREREIVGISQLL